MSAGADAAIARASAQTDADAAALARLPLALDAPLLAAGRPLPAREAAVLAGLDGRAVVLVGMMGAGKTSVGRRLAARLGVPFVDADAEIEAAAQTTIPEIFAAHGEAFFRDKERRVIARLLEAPGPQVLATGGGAFMHPETRAAIAGRGVSLWLRAEFDVLMRRVRRKANRPLLHGPDPEGTLRALIGARYPVYAEADITVLSREVSQDIMVEEVLAALHRRLARPQP